MSAPCIPTDESSRSTGSFTFVVPSNDETLLQDTFLRSPDLAGQTVIVQRGFRSASAAYNDALERVQTPYAIFLHQDIYLPAGWLHRVSAAITRLESVAARWALLGVWGVDKAGGYAGCIYSTGLKRLLRTSFTSPVEAQSLDEVVIVMRTSTGLRFDPSIPGFHFFGTDICLTAQEAGFSCHIIDAICMHNSTGIKYRPLAFWQAFKCMERKWRHRAPFRSACADVGLWSPPAWFQYSLDRARAVFYRGKTGVPLTNPAARFEELVASGQIPAQDDRVSSSTTVA